MFAGERLSMPGVFTEKVVLVTGGSFGIGRASACAFVRAGARVYAKTGIRVNAVCPGVIRTPMVERLLRGHPRAEARLVDMEPVRRLGTPEEVAEAVIWLCSDAASFVTGHTLTVDGGMVAQ